MGCVPLLIIAASTSAGRYVLSTGTVRKMNCGVQTIIMVQLAFRRHHITMVVLICIWVKVRGFGNILNCLNLRTKQNKKQNKSKLKLKQFCHDLNEWVLFGFLCGLAFCYQLTVSWKGFYIWGFSYSSVYPTTGHGIKLHTNSKFCWPNVWQLAGLAPS